PKRLTIFYTTYSTLALTTSGSGTITHSFSGNSLVSGLSYTVKAVPNPGNLFFNWTGDIPATNNPLTFLLETDTALTANFVTNFFIPAAGTYNGLFFTTNGVTEETAGMLYNLILT